MKVFLDLCHDVSEVEIRGDNGNNVKPLLVCITLEE
jgi:hypothetical protein